MSKLITRVNTLWKADLTKEFTFYHCPPELVVFSISQKKTLLLPEDSAHVFSVIEQSGYDGIYESELQEIGGVSDDELPILIAMLEPLKTIGLIHSYS